MTLVLLLQELLLLNLTLTARLGGGNGKQRAYWLGELLSEWLFKTVTSNVCHLALGQPLLRRGPGWEWVKDLTTVDILEYFLDWVSCGCPETTSSCCCCCIG